MRKPDITCPRCGGGRFEVQFHGAVVTMEVLGVYDDGTVQYGEKVATDENQEGLLVCKDCQFLMVESYDPQNILFLGLHHKLSKGTVIRVDGIMREYTSDDNDYEYIGIADNPKYYINGSEIYLDGKGGYIYAEDMRAYSEELKARRERHEEEKKNDKTRNY